MLLPLQPGRNIIIPSKLGMIAMRDKVWSNDARQDREDRLPTKALLALQASACNRACPTGYKGDTSCQASPDQFTECPQLWHLAFSIWPSALGIRHTKFATKMQ